MPCAVRPPDSAAGSVLESPATISEKKIPIDSTKAVFWKVAIMPLAAPRWLAGTEFIISARFGEANKPEPSTVQITDNGAGADPTFQAPAISKPTIATKTSGPYSVQTADCGTTLIANSASAITFNLPADATAGNGCQIQFKDQGAGVLTIARSGSQP